MSDQAQNIQTTTTETSNEEQHMAGRAPKHEMFDKNPEAGKEPGRVEKITNSAKETGGKIVQSIKSGFTVVKNTVVSLAMGVYNTLKSVFSQSWELIKSFFHREGLGRNATIASLVLGAIAALSALAYGGQMILSVYSLPVIAGTAAVAALGCYMLANATQHSLNAELIKETEKKAA